MNDDAKLTERALAYQRNEITKYGEGGLWPAQSV